MSLVASRHQFGDAARMPVNATRVTVGPQRSPLVTLSSGLSEDADKNEHRSIGRRHDPHEERTETNPTLFRKSVQYASNS